MSKTQAGVNLRLPAALRGRAPPYTCSCGSLARRAWSGRSPGRPAAGSRPSHTASPSSPCSCQRSCNDSAHQTSDRLIHEDALHPPRWKGNVRLCRLLWPLFPLFFNCVLLFFVLSCRLSKRDFTFTLLLRRAADKRQGFVFTFLGVFLLPGKESRWRVWLKVVQG